MKKYEEQLVESRRIINIEDKKADKELVSDKEFDNINGLSFGNIVYYKCRFNETNI